MVQIKFMIFESYQPRYEDRLIVPMDRFSDQEYLIDEKRCYDGLVKELKTLGVSGDPEDVLLPIFEQVFQTSRFIRPPKSVSYTLGPVSLLVIFD